MSIYCQQKQFYVYAYLREDKSPYYIGKGNGKRAYRRGTWERFKAPKNLNQIQIISDSMNEADAFQAEMLLIRMYGRKDIGTGILRNMTDGGEGGYGRKDSLQTKLRRASKHIGSKRSAKTCRNISQSKLGSTPWNKGKKNVYSEEQLEKLRKPKSDETKRKLSLAKLGKPKSAQAKLANQKAQLGRVWWTTGQKETRSFIAPNENWYRGRLFHRRKTKY